MMQDPDDYLSGQDQPLIEQEVQFLQRDTIYEDEQPEDQTHPESTEYISMLLQALHDPQWVIREAAAQTLTHTGQQIPVPIVMQVMQSEEDERVQETLLRALGQRSKQVPTDFFLSIFFENLNRHVRTTAADILGGLGPRAPFNALIYALRRDKDKLVRAAAAYALGKTGKCALQPILFESLNDKDEAVRDAVVWALQMLDEDTFNTQ